MVILRGIHILTQLRMYSPFEKTELQKDIIKGIMAQK